ncbi:DUF4097 family beta strand repeat-containing protein [Agromyces aerolatus]|uniref:DUF4097 family beta strand repeat-containing protein n=1 Tax=Agromyces sp. LY-1074 TaxID=3074080 RepID=UPI00285842CC|nr:MULTISPECIES: DUF4097 family beta strand repeat-containing protein [unclassified Agromyces]MDR5700570.1 DUF4097 family beta strand repeat-containing protein [Agromyces sp. LY-1074]MDR5707091.1 DUF4097 family beta strand repeat-containing protein [Agromyces sp. LY-1358]
MRATWARPIAAAGIVGAVVLTAGCGIIGPTMRTEGSAQLDATITEVRLDSGSGSVTVSGDDDDASLEWTVMTRANRTIGPTYSIDGGTLVLSGCGQWCSVDYRVRVPEGVDVTGRTSNGSIDLSDVGEVDLQTTNGRITLDGVDGRVRASSTNGRIEGEGLVGTGVEVRTSNGSIDLEIASAQDVSAESSNGSIDVRVPGGSYRVETQTSNGREEVQVPNTDDGRYLIDLRTSNGSISVKPTG